MTIRLAAILVALMVPAAASWAGDKPWAEHSAAIGATGGLPVGQDGVPTQTSGDSTSRRAQLGLMAR